MMDSVSIGVLFRECAATPPEDVVRESLHMLAESPRLHDEIQLPHGTFLVVRRVWMEVPVFVHEEWMDPSEDYPEWARKWGTTPAHGLRLVVYLKPLNKEM